MLVLGPVARWCALFSPKKTGFSIERLERGGADCIYYILCFCFNLPFFMFILRPSFPVVFFRSIKSILLDFPGWAGTLAESKTIDVDAHLLPPWSEKPMSYFSPSLRSHPKRPTRQAKTARPFLPNVPSKSLDSSRLQRSPFCQPAVLDVKDEGKKTKWATKKILVGWVIVGDDISYPVI